MYKDGLQTGRIKIFIAFFYIKLLAFYSYPMGAFLPEYKMTPHCPSVHFVNPVIQAPSQID